MKTVHPDVLDNGPAFILGNAARALVLPSYSPGMTAAQMTAAALIAVDISPVDFMLADAGQDRQLTFFGASGMANTSCAQGESLQIVFLDGAGRVLWVEEEASHRSIEAGQSYRLPSLTYLSPQPTISEE